MENKKIKAIILGSLSIILFMATYWAITNIAENKKSTTESQDLSQNKDGLTGMKSDQDLYKQALDEYDVSLCAEIKDEAKKSECLSTIQNATPTLEQAIALAQKGSYNFKEKDYGQRAEKIFLSILEKDQNNLNALLGMGYAYEIMQDYEKALSYYNRALALAPNNTAVYNRIGHMYDLSLGAEKAESFYRKSLEINPNFLNAKINLARVYLRQNKNEQAISMLKEVYASKEINPRTRAEVAYLLFADTFDHEKYDEAKEYIEEAKNIDPTLPMVWVGMGMSKLYEVRKLSSPDGAKQIYEESLGYFDKASELYSYQTAAYYWKGRTVMLTGDYASATSLFRTAKKVVKNDITLMSDQRIQFEKEIDSYLAESEKNTKKETSFFRDLFINTAHATACCSYWGWEGSVWTNHNSCVTWCQTQAQENAIYLELIGGTGAHAAKVTGNTVTCINGASATYVPIDNPPASCSPSWGAWSACSKTCGGGTQTRGDGCGGSDSQACNTQPCVPTVNISANPTSVPYVDGKTLLSWSSTDAIRCAASGAWSGDKAVARNNEPHSFPMNASTNNIDNTFSLKCWNSNNDSGEASAKVTVLKPPLPTLSLSISKVMVDNKGDSAIITWTSANADSCTASGSWNGDKGYNGTFSDPQKIDAFKTFSLSCKNVANQSVTRTVSACYKTDCAKDTCIGKKCQECSATGLIMVDGIKDCRDENWQEVSPN